MRAIVCGGRNYNDYVALSNVLDKLGVDYVICGGASGADALARQWADERVIPVDVYCAEWKKYGRSAGPRRNQQMLDEGRPDLIVAFEGGRGTADMVRKARDAKIAVVTVVPPKEDN